MFTEKNVNVIDSSINWEESIKIASKPLIEQRYIEEKYVENMIKSVNKLGFYIVLDEYVAMPHARPEEGVLKSGISFLKVNNSVKYGENNIKLIFVLAAIDSNSHIEIIKNILEILQNEEKKEMLLEAKTKEKLIEILS